MKHPMIAAAQAAFDEFDTIRAEVPVTAALQWLEDPENLSDAIVKAGASEISFDKQHVTSILEENVEIICSFTAMIKALRKEISHE